MSQVLGRGESSSVQTFWGGNVWNDHGVQDSAVAGLNGSQNVWEFRVRGCGHDFNCEFNKPAVPKPTGKCKPPRQS